MVERQRKTCFPTRCSAAGLDTVEASLTCTALHAMIVLCTSRLDDTGILVFQRVERLPLEYQRGPSSCTRSRYSHTPERPDRIPRGRITGGEIELDFDIVVHLLISY